MFSKLGGIKEGRISSSIHRHILCNSWHYILFIFKYGMVSVGDGGTSRRHNEGCHGPILDCMVLQNSTTPNWINYRVEIHITRYALNRQDILERQLCCGKGESLVVSRPVDTGVPSCAHTIKLNRPAWLVEQVSSNTFRTPSSETATRMARVPKQTRSSRMVCHSPSIGYAWGRE